MKWGAKVSRAIKAPVVRTVADVAGCCLVQEWRVQHLLKPCKAARDHPYSGLSWKWSLSFSPPSFLLPHLDNVRLPFHVLTVCKVDGCVCDKLPYQLSIYPGLD